MSSAPSFSASRRPPASSTSSRTRLGKRLRTWSRTCASLMWSLANCSTLFAVAAISSPYAFICWMEASTMAWNTPWMRPETKLGKSTLSTMAPNCSTPCFTAEAWKSLLAWAGLSPSRCLRDSMGSGASSARADARRELLWSQPGSAR